MPASTRTLIAFTVSALALCACGSEQPTLRERTGNFSVTLDDYLVRPQRITVPASGRLRVTVTNRGRLGHTFRIRSTNHNVLALTTLEPGETKVSRRFRLAKGSYRMYCVLANHEELGMYGTLVVR